MPTTHYSHMLSTLVHLPPSGMPSFQCTAQTIKFLYEILHLVYVVSCTPTVHVSAWLTGSLQVGPKLQQL